MPSMLHLKGYIVFWLQNRGRIILLAAETRPNHSSGWAESFFWLQNRGRIILLLIGCASTHRYPENARALVMSQVARVLWDRG